MADQKKRQPILTHNEIAKAFAEDSDCDVSPIVSPEQLAAIVNVARSTIYFWIQQGRLDGAFRKRGKHILLWRDKVIDILFNTPDW